MVLVLVVREGVTLGRLILPCRQKIFKKEYL